MKDKKQNKTKNTLLVAAALALGINAGCGGTYSITFGDRGEGVDNSKPKGCPPTLVADAWEIANSGPWKSYDYNTGCYRNTFTMPADEFSFRKDSPVSLSVEDVNVDISFCYNESKPTLQVMLSEGKSENLLLHTVDTQECYDYLGIEKLETCCTDPIGTFFATYVREDMANKNHQWNGRIGSFSDFLVTAYGMDKADELYEDILSSVRKHMYQQKQEVSAPKPLRVLKKRSRERMIRQLNRLRAWMKILL
jgi:hypothetical protein